MRLVFLLNASLLVCLSLSAFAINPITDVCWSCLYPMTIGGVDVQSKGGSSESKSLCFCAGAPPRAGLTFTFWEPALLVEVTTTPFKLVSLGGVQAGPKSFSKQGSVGIVGDGPSQSSFYHVHVFRFPILRMVEVLSDLSSPDYETFHVAYMSEMDPTWNSDGLSLFFNPEAGLFANPAAQGACIADCAAANMNKSINPLFWCAGCQGSLYPLTGSVAHHVGGLQASSLLAHRALAKLHRLGLLRGFAAGDFCSSKYMPFIKKGLYKIQLIHPKVHSEGPCPPLGKSDLLWGMGKVGVSAGSDFAYIIWTKQHRCLDVVKPGLKAVTAT